MIFRRGGFWLAGLACAATLGACVGVTSEVGSMKDEGGGGQGNESEQGAMKPADDGCNSCTCDADGNWQCTEIDCSTCQEGTMKPAGDGCNTCTCRDGDWSCTQKMCTGACTLGEMRTEDCNSCVCTDFGDGPTWACTTNVCTECTDG